MDPGLDLDVAGFLAGTIPYKKLAADSSASWSFVAQTLQRADTTKVKDSKEDIDTLLVFAGLFSAVMTGFLVESYKTLLPNQSASTVEVLEAISSQMTSFIVSNQFANSTRAAAVASIPPSHPTAVRINALWFASLICSLVSASLGMLVKQWLREYLAVDYLAPQARVRIRQFRWQGLKTWRVFEIAALLPLLLQVALGLFFLGLCLFTLSINTVVGWTSTPLVLAWVTFFAFTILAPAISAHCPFKTSFLKFALKPIRRLLRRHTSPFSEESTGSGNVPGSPTDSPRSSHSSLTLQTEKQRFESKPKEEEDALRNQTQDLSILLAFDAINSDDELLGTVIRTIVKPTRRNGEDILVFCQKLVQHRLQIDVSSIEADRYAPYLPLRARLALVDILSDALCYEVQQRLFPTRRDAEEVTLSGWPSRALQMIVALAGGDMQNSKAAAMAYCLMFDPSTFKAVMGNSTLSVSDLLTLLGVAGDKLRDSPGSAIMDFLRNTSQWYSNAMGMSRSNLALPTLSEILESAEPKLPGDCLSAILGLVVDTLRAHRNSPWEPWMTEGIDCLVDASDPAKGHYCVAALDKVCDLIAKMLMEDSAAREVLQSLMRADPFDWHSRYWMLGLVLGRKLSTIQDGVPAMLRNMEGAFKDPRFSFNPIHACNMVCNMASYFFAPEDIQTHRSQWRALFTTLSSSVTTNLDLNLSDRLAIAHCLERIDVFDNVEASAPGVPEGGANVDPIVPNYFIEVLLDIAEEHARKVENLNRVSTLRRQKELARTPRTENANVPSASETRSIADEVFEDALEDPATGVPFNDSLYLRPGPPAWTARGYSDWQRQPISTFNSPTIASAPAFVHEYSSSYDPTLVTYPSIEEWLRSLDDDPVRSREHQVTYSRYTETLTKNGIYDLGDVVRLRMAEPQQAIQRLQDLGGMVYGVASRLLDFAQIDAGRSYHQRGLSTQTLPPDIHAVAASAPP
ncbi:hypothetical protein NM688_g5367 [Phlebia brevispora]|uniref:Uncharacterized protein n=1 Tax=Phlebia brevispora TaxID=194682 RepID=A0ACC1SWS9_9APHY|nr:hypothetical protein NM688_g5367 [Phlebia brevispora]